MGRTVLPLLLAGVIAVLVGVIGTVAVADVAVTSSDVAAKTADAKDLGKPADYGAR